MNSHTCQFENVGNATICGQPAFLQLFSGEFLCVAHGMPIVRRWKCVWRPIPTPKEYGAHGRLWRKVKAALKRCNRQRRRGCVYGGGADNRKEHHSNRFYHLGYRLDQEQARIIAKHRRRDQHEQLLLLAKMEAQAARDSTRREHLINAYELFRNGSGLS